MVFFVDNVSCGGGYGYHGIDFIVVVIVVNGYCRLLRGLTPICFVTLSRSDGEPFQDGVDVCAKEVYRLIRIIVAISEIDVIVDMPTVVVEVVPQGSQTVYD